MIKTIDNFLNKVTMYRLVLYVLISIYLAAMLLGSLNILPYDSVDMALSAAFITAVCFFINFIFAWAFRAPSNIESVYITALILALIIDPSEPFNNLLFLGWAAMWAMASKYILAVNLKHIFNPAAFAVALTALAIDRSASWWVGTLYLAPFVLIGGFLIARKIKRFDLVLSFFAVSLLATAAFTLMDGRDLVKALTMAALYSPMAFFAFVMLTEPMTTPPTRALRLTYGALVGFLFAPAVHVGPVYFTPEMALIAGNIFAYIVSPKYKLVLALKEKIESASNTYDFVFNSGRKLDFQPGQYMEWTLEHPSQDDRGIRRFFTIASSPTEEDVRMGIKFYPDPSSFKRSLIAMGDRDTIVASQLAGDFVLPSNKEQKLVFVAGGVGVTPFRSMVKYLLDSGEKRSIVFFYSNKEISDILYKDIFDKAGRDLGMKSVYTLTDAAKIPPTWQGQRGYINEEMIRTEVPDYKERIFYLSGPRVMVSAFEEVLAKMGVRRTQIKTDYFPGFA